VALPALSALSEMTPVSSETNFTVTLERVRDYEFTVRFEGAPFTEITTDEAPPLGNLCTGGRTRQG